MGKHDHASCEHDVAWCRHCDVAYCQNCDITWTRGMRLNLNQGVATGIQYWPAAYGTYNQTAPPPPIGADIPPPYGLTGQVAHAHGGASDGGG